MLTERLKAVDSGANVVAQVHVLAEPHSFTSPADIKRDVRGFAFEELLMNSRAYRTAARNNSDAFSVISSAGRTASWSILSGLSLSEISNIAILALPVYSVDIANSNAYDFDTPITDPAVAVGPAEEADSPSKKRRGGRRSLSRLAEFFRVQTDSKVSEKPPDEGNIVFGMPLKQSITYANVAISLTNEAGESFVYGYVPIVVGRCGVYLKEKGSEYQVNFLQHGGTDSITQLIYPMCLLRPVIPRAYSQLCGYSTLASLLIATAKV
jgi:hypothetical protein